MDYKSELKKYNDKTPWWDGEPPTWEAYRRRALLYVDGTKVQERYLCGPRLAARLSGAAREAILHKRRGWLSSAGGAERLLRTLRRNVYTTEVSEVGHHIEPFLFHLRRRRGETISGWINRSRNRYHELRVALARVVNPEKKKAAKASSVSVSYETRPALGAEEEEASEQPRGG